jgi:hypothetical protein
MAQLEGLAIPTGMLRISKQGEQDRVIYPVHADGWRKIGWTVHPPELELEEDEEEMGEVSGPAEAAPSPPVLHEGEAHSAPESMEPLELDGLTKAEIVAAVAERYGVQLEMSDTRAELIAAAERLAAEAAAVGSDASQGTEAGLEADAEMDVPPMLL